MPSEKIPELINTSISTCRGEAIYSHTELEDADGKWNDNWWTNNGEYVTHEEFRHHVYIVK